MNEDIIYNDKFFIGCMIAIVIIMILISIYVFKAVYSQLPDTAILSICHKFDNIYDIDIRLNNTYCYKELSIFWSYKSS